MQVRIGIGDGAREMDLEVEDAAGVAESIEAALTDGFSGLVWITDIRGRRVGIPGNRIAYLEIESQEKASVGFGGGG